MLSFEDLDKATIDSPIANGVTEKLRTLLSQSAAVGLTPASEKSRGNFDIWKQQDWHDLGGELSARSLLSGTVRTHNGKTRITVQLIDAVSCIPIKRWLQETDSDEHLVGDIAKSIASVIRVHANHKALPTTEQ